MLTLRSATLSLFGLFLLGLTACGPDYPGCYSDEHCESKGQVCVNAQCQQCRDDSQCPTPGQYCSDQKCAYKIGYCDENRRCSGDQKCRNNQCGPACLDNTECKANEFCDGGSCVVKPECGQNADQAECAEGYNCQDGRCVRQLTRCTTSEPIYFSFNSDKVKRSEQSKLNELAECLKGSSVAPIQIAGHADDVGSTEYNYSLGDARATSVKNYLERLGVSSSLMSTISYGEDKPAVSSRGRQAKNRRVEFE